MLIKMLKNDKGSENGIVVNDYIAGKEYQVGEELGKAFTVFRGTAIELKAEEAVNQGVGVEGYSASTIEAAPEKATEEKAVEAAPENKALKVARKTK